MCPLKKHRAASFLVFGCVIAVPLCGLIVASWMFPWRIGGANNDCGPIYTRSCGDSEVRLDLHSRGHSLQRVASLLTKLDLAEHGWHLLDDLRYVRFAVADASLRRLLLQHMPNDLVRRCSTTPLTPSSFLLILVISSQVSSK